MKKLRIILADDHAMIREGLRLLLQTQPDLEVVGEASNGQEVMSLAEQLQPDLILLDVSMPQMNGLKTTEVLKKSNPNLKILPLTRHTDVAYIQQMLKAGASGYMLKQSDSSELLHAIRAVVDGRTYLDPLVAEKLLSNVYGRTPRKDQFPQQKLSTRETEVIRLIAQGYSNKEVVASLDISVKTVETYKANVMKKLDLKSRIDIVRYAILCGWMEDL